MYACQASNFAPSSPPQNIEALETVPLLWPVGYSTVSWYSIELAASLGNSYVATFSSNELATSAPPSASLPRNTASRFARNRTFALQSIAHWADVSLIQRSTK
jgi:hypothetical protein